MTSLTPVAGVCSFCSPVCSCLCPRNLFFLFFLSSFFASSATALSRGKAGFESLGLGSLEREESLLLEPWDYTFEEVL